jgi:hypothetical protein
MPKTLVVLALLLTSCKLGPFPDEPVQQPEAPIPEGWNSPEGVGQDAGIANDASVPTAEPGK